MNHLEGLALMHAHALPLRWYQPTPGDWADVLATFPLFTGISKRRLRKLARSATLAEFAPGETIVFAGDRGDALCVVLGGAAKTARPGVRDSVQGNTSAKSPCSTDARVRQPSSRRATPT
jgi:hypothetical protein